MKYRVPIAIYSLFTRAQRNDSRMIPPKPSHNFVYKSSWLWNKFRDTESGLDFATTTCKSLKSRLNLSLLNAQNRYCTEWHDYNFTEFGPADTWTPTPPYARRMWNECKASCYRFHTNYEFNLYCHGVLWLTYQSCWVEVKAPFQIRIYCILSVFCVCLRIFYAYLWLLLAVCWVNWVWSAS